MGQPTADNLVEEVEVASDAVEAEAPTETETTED